MLTPSMIGVDWGTSSFRAFLLDANGICIEQRLAKAGIQQIHDNFEQCLTTHIGDWLTCHVALPVLMCGMIGSRQGWQETAYLPCPFDAASLAHGLTRVTPFNQGNCWIVPGVKCFSEAGYIDVMRGEETQALGAQLLLDENLAWLCMPGTHNKWLTINDGEVSGFNTAMTGEMFAIISEHSILRHSLATSQRPHKTEFAKGVVRAIAEPALLNLLFSVRSEHLFESHQSEANSEYLSGLLIGSEIASLFCQGKALPRHSGAIVASNDLARRYQQALALLDINVPIIDGELAVIHGLLSIAQAASIIQSRYPKESLHGLV